MFSGRPSQKHLDETGVDLHTFRQVFEQGNLFACGCAVDYAPSLIVAKHTVSNNELLGISSDTSKSSQDLSQSSGKQHLATGIPIGMRIPSFKILNQSDARPWHLQELLVSNGTWRILVFAGDIRDPGQFARYQLLGSALEDEANFLRKFTPKEHRVDSCFEVLTVHSSPRSEIELLSLPDIFHPFSDEYGWDYNKIFVDDASYHEGHGQAYQNYGIDPHSGCVVIVRPDQYVSWIGKLEDVKEMNEFFDSFMRSETDI